MKKRAIVLLLGLAMPAIANTVCYPGLWQSQFKQPSAYGFLQAKADTIPVLASNLVDITSSPYLDRTPGVFMDYSAGNGPSARVNPISGKSWGWYNYDVYAYEGEMFVEEGKSYQFYGRFDDGVALVVDGKLVVHQGVVSGYNGEPEIATYYTASGTGWVPFNAWIWDWIGGKNVVNSLYALQWNTNGVTNSFSDAAVWSRFSDPLDMSFLRVTAAETFTSVDSIASAGDDLVVSLVCSNLPSSAVVFACFGETDAGIVSTSGWDHVTLLGTVVTNATQSVSFTGTVSGGANAMALRFFLVGEKGTTGYFTEWTESVALTPDPILSLDVVSPSFTNGLATIKLLFMGIDSTEINLTFEIALLEDGFDEPVAMFSLPINPISSTGSYVIPFSGLETNTTYWARAVAISDGGRGVSAVLPFTTLAPGNPAASIQLVSTSYSTATFRCSVSSLGDGGEKASLWLELSANGTFDDTISFPCGVSISEPSTFELSGTGLENGQTYTVRIRVRNDWGLESVSGVVRATTRVLAENIYAEVVNGIEWVYTKSSNAASVGTGPNAPRAIATTTTGVVEIPSFLGGLPVTSISDYAFSGISGLTSIAIPDSVTSIGYNAFSSCRGLTSITIPDSVTSIGYSAFSSCSGLMYISVDEDNPVFDSRNGCNAIIRSADNTLVVGCKNSTIPDSVTSIGGFSGCSELMSIAISDSVTNIETYAFDGCYGITNIVLGSSIASIGTCAFRNCSGLTSLTMPNSVTSIGESAFDGCSGLTSITIPDSVTNIGRSAFNRCTSLGAPIFSSSSTTLWFVPHSVSDSFQIPDNVTNIGSYAFSGCSGLMSIEIPNSVTSIGESAFSGCSGLTSLTIPDGVMSIGNSAFYGCHGLTSVSVDEDNPIYDSRNSCNAIVRTADDTLVVGCEKSTIPDTVTSIDNYAFYGCSGLTSITIPDSVTNIGNAAFSGCSGLTSIEIPDSVTNIGKAAFYGCSGLTSVLIPDSITTLEADMFWNCSLLISITIPNSVTSIGTYAFYRCSGLTSIAIPDSVTNIGKAAFDSCSGLTSIVIPDGVTSIEDHVFGGCSGLRSIAIPDSVTSIGESAFSCCSKLESINLPQQVSVINGHAFRSCSRLRSLTIPGSVLAVGSELFKECNSLESIRLPRHFQTKSISLSCPSATEIIFYDASTLGSPVPVSYDWLDSYPELMARCGNSYEEAALSLAANGINSVWECYLVGLDPTSSESSFIGIIKMEKGEPIVSWMPDLGKGRTYVIEGKKELSDEKWEKNTDNHFRFFRVIVKPPTPYSFVETLMSEI